MSLANKENIPVLRIQWDQQGNRGRLIVRDKHQNIVGQLYTRGVSYEKPAKDYGVLKIEFPVDLDSDVLIEGQDYNL